MRKVTVTGHLGADPEFRTSQNGASYVTFRLANNEPTDKDKNGNQTTYWFSVTVWDSVLQNLCKSMKKGSSVIVDGDLSDRPYTSQKTGMVEVGRDIRAKAIYFNGSGKRDDDVASSTQQKATTTVKEEPVKQNVPVTKPEVQVMDNEEDDLPF